MLILFKYFPLFALLYSVIPAFMRRNLYTSVPEYNTENASKFRAAYWGSVIYMTIVWLPMIVGILFGNVPTMLHFFVRGTGNLFINSYWIVQLTLSIVGIVWLYFFNGGEFVEKYYLPLMSMRGKGSNPSPISPSFIKLIPIISLIALIILWLYILPDDMAIIDEMLSGLQ